MAKKKRSLSEQAEEIDAMGQDSETKAVKWVQERAKEDEKDENETIAQETWKLQDSRKKVFTYRDALVQAMVRRMLEYDLPKGFAWKIETPQQDIILVIGDPKGQMYARGLKPIGEPKYDLNAIDRVIWKALDAIDHLEQHYAKPVFTK